MDGRILSDSGLRLEVLAVKMICYLQVEIGQASDRNP